MARANQIVAIDIGGTHARFAIAEHGTNGGIALGEPVTLQIKDHVEFQSAWACFDAQRDGTLPRAVAMAIAGSVDDGTIRFTNNPWVIRLAEMEAELDLDKCIIVNDFEAVAHAVARAPDDQFLHLTGPDQPLGAHGTITVLGPGTGLGVAHLRRGGGQYHVQATEGGHIDFAPLDQIDDAILARLRTRHNRVSVERVVAGPAIVDIYRTLAALKGRAVAEVDDVTLWARGMDGSDSLAAAAVERFCLSLGSVAGDMALAQGGFAGVVIAGGLGLRLKDTLLQSGFGERFRAKGRFEPLMRSIPVKLIIMPQPGLFGAAAAYFTGHGDT